MPEQTHADPATAPIGRAGAVVAGRRSRALLPLLAALGPGVMVMLADTDAGSVITAAQSGARYGYRLALWQLVLIPILYLVQEMTVRLGLATGKGHGALIRETFGARWAWLSAGTLFVACIGALITEFAGVAGVGTLYGIPRAVSIGVVAALLAWLVLGGRYRRVERIGIAIGSLELLFIPAALLAHPHLPAIASGLAHPWISEQSYVLLLAANVGAVIMPWMVFYQQAAVIDRTGTRRLPRPLRAARIDTMVGAVVTQVVMLAVLVAAAATIGRSHPGASLSTVGEIAHALTPALGARLAEILFGMGMLGAAMIAALVVSLAGAWGVAEVLGWRHSLSDRPRQAAGFYTLGLLGVLGGAVLVVLAPSLVALSVDVEIMNALLLPVVLGLLLLLERRALPPAWQMRGPRRAITYLLSALVIGLGLYVAAVTVVGTVR
ncbi:MAG: NRAMP family divalent metal transporter [Actinomycetes bacterium]